MSLDQVLWYLSEAVLNAGTLIEQLRKGIEGLAGPGRLQRSEHVRFGANQGLHMHAAD